VKFISKEKKYVSLQLRVSTIDHYLPIYLTTDYGATILLCFFESNLYNPHIIESLHCMSSCVLIGSVSIIFCNSVHVAGNNSICKTKFKVLIYHMSMLSNLFNVFHKQYHTRTCQIYFTLLVLI
jgi:hypothetical protein